MRNFILAAAVALAVGTSPADAQIVIGSGYSQPYYGGSQPYFGGYSQPYYSGAAIGDGGLIQAAGGYLLDQAGLGGYVAPYTSGYGNFGTQPYYGGGYRTYGSYYGGNTYRSYGGGRGNGWGRRR